MIELNSASLPQLGCSPEAMQSFLLVETRLREKHQAMNAWFESQWQKTPPPAYGSVDLRNAGFKLAPVDMNLFPAGFNNLNPDFLTETVQAAKEAILSLVPSAKSIALIPESYTRNAFYWENVRVLADILKRAGFLVKITPLSDNIVEKTAYVLESGEELIFESLIRGKDKLRAGDMMPDVILLNNDLSQGIPPMLRDLQQPLLPPATLGWHQRLKSEHFHYYAAVGREFADILTIDPWLITPLFRHCGEIDFLHREGMDRLVDYTAALLADIQKKYQEYHVSQKPFVVIKANAGTQGIAVMTVRDVEELRALNRKQRTAMAKSKGGIPVRSVIVQEGVYTVETFGTASNVAEPVVYMWGKRVVGGFYRIHQGRGVDESLNVPGMHFNASPFAWNCAACPEDISAHSYPQHLYTYGVIAQLSMLAAAKEIKEIKET